MTGKGFLVMIAALALSGCASYSWRSDVPGSLRTVCVPTFRNESNVTELGSAMTRQVLRELQREGTFSVSGADEAAVEVQGVVKQAGVSSSFRDRRSGTRVIGCDITATVEISIVDHRSGRVMVDNRRYKATTTGSLLAGDSVTALRDASGRLGEDLARQVVDDMLNLKWKDN